MNSLIASLGCAGPMLKWLDVRPSVVVDRDSRAEFTEKVPDEVMLQLAVLHKTWFGSLIVHSGALRGYLQQLTLGKGRAYDDPESAKHILKFISDYNIDMSTVPEPVAAYPTLNAFFSRAHCAGSRPIEQPGNDAIVVQPCDCRLSVFTSVDKAKELWVKGHRFCPETLLGPAYTARWRDCELVLSRLAPSDHHRFYMPCRGRLRRCTWIEGDFYSVKPLVVNSSLDVFGKNRRCVAELTDTPIGDVLMVIVGAAEVGSIRFSVEVGAALEKGEELGLFAYGGSSVVTLFAPGSVAFDADLHSRSLEGVETLVQLGTSLGRANVQIAAAEE